MWGYQMWTMKVSQALVGMLAGRTRQAAQQAVTGTGDLQRWLRSNYRREVLSKGALYQGDKADARHQAYVDRVSASLAEVDRKAGRGASGEARGRGRPMEIQKWSPQTLAGELAVVYRPGDTLVSVFQRWATEQRENVAKLFMLAQDQVKEVATSTSQQVVMVRAALQKMLQVHYPAWVRAKDSWGMHFYGSGLAARMA